MFERFTTSARRTVVLAQEECRLLQHEHIGTEHLLLAMFDDEDSPAAQALRAAGVTQDSANDQVRALLGTGGAPSAGHLPFTGNAQRAIEIAGTEADRRGQVDIESAHLLLGLLRQPECRAMQVIAALGVDPATLVQTAERAAGIRTGGSARPGAPRPDAPDARDAVAHAPGAPGTIDRLITQRRALAEALARYGRHEDGCPGGQACSCGLAEALSLARDDG